MLIPVVGSNTLSSPGGSHYPALTLVTGAVTSYVDYDDAYHANLGLGISKLYEVRTTGRYALTTNIDLAHYTSGAGAVTFDNTAKTIVDTGNGLAIFLTGDVITTSSTNNPGPFTVTTGNVAGTITCTGATFVDETPAGAVTFYKREAHSNACVQDLKTGLMWSQIVSDKMGAASDGLLPWTTVAAGYGIFPYRIAANAGIHPSGTGLALFTDWRVPNIDELFSIIDKSKDTPAIDTTIFPSFPPDSNCASATTVVGTTSYVWEMEEDRGYAYRVVKTALLHIILVRGGNQ